MFRNVIADIEFPQNAEPKIVITSGRMELAMAEHVPSSPEQAGLLTIDGKGLQFNLSSPVSLDMRGQLAGTFTAGEQKLRLVIPKGLNVNVSSAALKLVGGRVDRNNSSISGSVELPLAKAMGAYARNPFWAGAAQLATTPGNPPVAAPSVPDGPINGALKQRYNLKSLANMSSGLNAGDINGRQVNAIQLSGLQKQVLRASLAYALELKDSIPATETVAIPFAMHAWDGAGIVDTEKSLPAFYTGGEFQASSSKVTIDLSTDQDPANSGNGASWMGLVMENITVTLPDDFKNENRSVKIPTNQTFTYERNGLCGFYNPPPAENEGETGSGIAVDNLLNFNANVREMQLDIYGGRVKAELLGQLKAHSLDGRMLGYRMIIDSGTETKAINIREENPDSPGLLTVTGGRLEEREGDVNKGKGDLYLNGTLQTSTGTETLLNGLSLQEPAEFADLVIPCEAANMPRSEGGQIVVSDVNPVYGYAKFTKPVKAKLRDVYSVEIRGLRLGRNGTFTDMQLEGGIKLADNLPFNAGVDADRVYINNALIPQSGYVAASVKPQIVEGQTNVQLEYPFEDIVNLSSYLKLIGKEFRGDGQFSFSVKDNGDNGDDEDDNTGLGQIAARIGGNYWVFGLKVGADGIPLGPMKLRELGGALGYNVDIPDNYSLVKNDLTIIYDWEVENNEDPKAFLIAATSMELKDIFNLNSAQLIIESGPSLELSGEGVILGQSIGPSLVGYYHPGTFKASITFNELKLECFDIGSLNGSVGFEAGPSTWGVYVGYPEIMKMRTPDGIVYGFGVGFRSQEDAWLAMAKAMIGYDTGDIELGIVYLHAAVSAEGEVVVTNESFAGALTIRGEGDGGIIVLGDRYPIIQLALMLQGSVSSPPFVLAGDAEVYYHLDLFLIEKEGSVDWHIEYAA